MLVRPLRPRTLRFPIALHRRLRHDNPKPTHETDHYGVPLGPTWSVHELLSSYPQPVITAPTLKRLHDLSALIPPEEGTPEHEHLTREMEGLVKLVEAVKLVDTSAVKGEGIPDGRICAQGAGIELTEEYPPDRGDASVDEAGQGRDLLRHSSTAKDGLYVVQNDRSK